MRIFEKKTLKIAIYLRRLGASPPDLRVVNPVYYYNFIEFVSKR